MIAPAAHVPLAAWRSRLGGPASIAHEFPENRADSLRCDLDSSRHLEAHLLRLASYLLLARYRLVSIVVDTIQFAQ